MKRQNIRLTQKTVHALIKQEFGISVKLTAEYCEGVYIYKAKLGRFEITVQNDWLEKNGLIVLDVSSGVSGERMHFYYAPDTLKENFEAEENYRNKIQNELCEGCNKQ